MWHRLLHKNPNVYRNKPLWYCDPNVRFLAALLVAVAAIVIAAWNISKWIPFP